MGFTIEYREEQAVLVLEASGDLNLELSKAMIDAEVEMLLKHPEASILYDQSSSTADEISGDDIFAISEYSGRLSELLTGKKLAVVLRDDLSFGLGRMWQSFTEVNAPFEIKLFRCPKEAMKWITE
ncbi:MAG: hypothetical protein NE328_20135 [Lentisphaeraceae bacterium]|nr:hypothetical protein [Lentisphaeraceae bacterium]